MRGSSSFLLLTLSLLASSFPLHLKGALALDAIEIRGNIRDGELCVVGDVPIEFKGTFDSLESHNVEDVSLSGNFASVLASENPDAKCYTVNSNNLPAAQSEKTLQGKWTCTISPEAIAGMDAPADVKARTQFDTTMEFEGNLMTTNAAVLLDGQRSVFTVSGTFQHTLVSESQSNEGLIELVIRDFNGLPMEHASPELMRIHWAGHSAFETADGMICGRSN